MSESNQLKNLNGILNLIGNFSPSEFLSSFSSRLIFQKTIYLLQSFGIYLGYNFTWYIHGPYSVDLTKVGYNLAQGKFDQTVVVKFSKESSYRKFENFLEFIGDKKNSATWLETVASLHFLRKIYPNKSRKEINQEVLKKQDDVTMIEINEAWKHLEQFDLA